MCHSFFNNNKLLFINVSVSWKLKWLFQYLKEISSFFFFFHQCTLMQRAHTRTHLCNSIKHINSFGHLITNKNGTSFKPLSAPVTNLLPPPPPTPPSIQINHCVFLNTQQMYTHACTATHNTENSISVHLLPFYLFIFILLSVMDLLSFFSWPYMLSSFSLCTRFY